MDDAILIDGETEVDELLCVSRFAENEKRILNQIIEDGAEWLIDSEATKATIGDHDEEDEEEETDETLNMLKQREESLRLLASEGGDVEEVRQKLMECSDQAANFLSDNDDLPQHAGDPTGNQANGLQRVEILGLPDSVAVGLQCLEIGVLHALVPPLLVVKSNKGSRPLDIGSILCMSDRYIIGPICDTFGPVTEPFYTAFIDQSRPAVSSLKVDDPIFVDVSHSTYILPASGEIPEYMTTSSRPRPPTSRTASAAGDGCDDSGDDESSEVLSQTSRASTTSRGGANRTLIENYNALGREQDPPPAIEGVIKKDNTFNRPAPPTFHPPTRSSRPHREMNLATAIPHPPTTGPPDFASQAHAHHLGVTGHAPVCSNQHPPLYSPPFSSSDYGVVQWPLPPASPHSVPPPFDHRGVPPAFPHSVPPPFDHRSVPPASPHSVPPPFDHRSIPPASPHSVPLPYDQRGSPPPPMYHYQHPQPYTTNFASPTYMPQAAAGACFPEAHLTYPPYATHQYIPPNYSLHYSESPRASVPSPPGHHPNMAPIISDTERHSTPNPHMSQVPPWRTARPPLASSPNLRPPGDL